MTHPSQKILQYLDEAHATESGLVRELQAQIAMAPRGSYRTGLEKHLRETRDHAERLRTRMRELGDGGGVLQAGIGIAETVATQALALGRTPLALLRGSGGEEKVLKNAKDACATEALEIATYTAIEQLAQSLGDDETARLARSIRADEQRMLDRIIKEIPKLTEAVVRADVRGNGSYDIATTGAADAARTAGRKTRAAARQTGAKAGSAARQTGAKAGSAARQTGAKAGSAARQTGAQAGSAARKAPGATRAEGVARGAVARERDLAIARYDSLNADEIIARLPELSQVELGKVEVYERRHDNRSTVIERISTLRASEPWPGYDELTVDELRAALAEADESRARAARDYERAHKNRAGVIAATERELAGA
jgi:ferritin-like metal-binding protein YciE